MTSVRQEWKPTGRTFSLYDSYPLTRIVEPLDEPLFHTPRANMKGWFQEEDQYVEC